MAKRSRAKSVYVEKHSDLYDGDYNTRMNTMLNETPGIRVGGRQKKAKAIFDPSDYQFTSIKRKKDTDESFKDDKVQRTPSKRLSLAVPISSPIKTASTSLVSTAKCMSCQKSKSFNNETKLKDCSGKGNCRNKIHALCLEKEKKKRQFQPNQWHVNDCWICEDCLECSVCNGKKTNIDLYTCSKCGKNYHPHCHNPKFSNRLPSRVDWRCKQCVVPIETMMKELHSSPKRIQTQAIKSPAKVVLTRMKEPPKTSLIKDTIVVKRISVAHKSDTEVESSFNGFTKAEMTQHNDLIDYDDSDSGVLSDIKEESKEVPDVSKWTYNDVYVYFQKHFGKDALIFKEQEIDGTCILVMKRSDVIPGFQNGTNIKLGKLLKMYNHIVKFQTKINSPSLSWK
ncbi:unnamed protein product [Diamesa hyperborea]